MPPSPYTATMEWHQPVSLQGSYRGPYHAACARLPNLEIKAELKQVVMLSDHLTVLVSALVAPPG